MSKLIKIFFVVIFLAGLFFGGRYFLRKSNTAPQTAIEQIKDEVLPPQPQTVPAENSSTSVSANQPTVTLPGKVAIKVPFTSQAPFGVWDARHEEACEEASLIMLHAYLTNTGLNPTEAEKQIQNMIDFEIKKYGDYKDTSVEENVKLYDEFFGPPSGGKSLKVIYDFDKNDLKIELAKDNPIIVPAAGRELGNPNFTAPGPIYHNLVLVGYSGNQIITNDPGTRKGEGYRYDINVLYNAIHDFAGDLGNIDQGKKAMIVVETGK
jgi:hypothetical protein